MVPVALVSGHTSRSAHLPDWLWIGLMTLGRRRRPSGSNWAHRFVGVTCPQSSWRPTPCASRRVRRRLLCTSRIGLMQIIGGLAAIMAVAVVAAEQCASRPSRPWWLDATKAPPGGWNGMKKTNKVGPGPQAAHRRRPARRGSGGRPSFCRRGRPVAGAGAVVSSRFSPYR